MILLALSQQLVAASYKEFPYIVQQQKDHYIPYCKINDPQVIDELMWNQSQELVLIKTKLETVKTSEFHWAKHGFLEGGLTYKEYMQISCGARMKIKDVSKGAHYSIYGDEGAKLDIWFPDGRLIGIRLYDMRIATSFYKKRRPDFDSLSKEEVIELLAKNSVKIASFLESEEGQKLQRRGIAILFRKVMQKLGGILLAALAA